MADNDYLMILEALTELPFSVGKKLLGDVLNGKSTDSIHKNRLDKLSCYGSMPHDQDELNSIIDSCISHRFIEIKSVPKNKYWKVLHLSEKGRLEIKKPTLKQLDMNLANKKTEISECEQELFKQFDFLLKQYNPEQKKTIISNQKSILCIAGAGTGKTAVLTKRIEFLTQFRSVPAKKILAITFTRKAKIEMEHRLKNNQYCSDVTIETFNSFSEKILKKYNDLIYDKPVSVLTYREKIKLVGNALKSINMNMKQAVAQYFSSHQKKLKSEDLLWNIFINDCFGILDHYKNENKEIEDFSNNYSLSTHDKNIASMMYSICMFINTAMHEIGKRDFADQLVDCVKVFKSNPEIIPKYDHILIDEYQDINAVQIDLIELLNSENIFCVGDPRQSIFGWRGSRIKYILDFQKRYPNSEVITLTTNYRSNTPVVELANLAIKQLKLPDLNSGTNKTKKDLALLKFDNTDQEYIFILDQIKNELTSKKDIFILARTNRTLLELAEKVSAQGINYILRSDEVKRSADDKDNAITLATIHAIKGLESKTVYIVGCNTNNFPCRASDHPVIDLIKNGDYDKEEEERRLFYVAISRAKEKLVMTYTGSMSKFITNDMKKQIGVSYNRTLKEATQTGDTLTDLKSWRRELALKYNVPAYTILTDATIQEIINQQPLTLDELEQVKGIGPAKISKYGEKILNLVNGF